MAKMRGMLCLHRPTGRFLLRLLRQLSLQQRAGIDISIIHTEAAAITALDSLSR